MSAALMAIGGAIDLRNPEVLAEFYRRAGGRDAQLVILPTASTLPDTGDYYKNVFDQFGLKYPALVLPLYSRQDALDEDNSAALHSASGVFLVGGNQMRYITWLNGTPASKHLSACAESAQVIAGTSAGAAVLSRWSIAYGKSGPSPRQGQAHFLPGLGFTDKVLFDQHFRQRDRLGRLILATLSFPGVVGVGVDENTAAMLDGDTLSVFGQHSVTIVDASQSRENDLSELEEGDPVAASGLSVHILTKGGQFNLTTRQATLKPKSLHVV